jgi:serine/threonine-protein kinase
LATRAYAESKMPPLCSTCREKISKHPQPIPGYRLIEEVGRGGLGVVYQALHLSDGTILALKTIIPAQAPTQSDLGRFQREASILYELDHPNIVAFRDMGETDGTLYFAMDYVRGTDAGRLLRAHGPLPVARAVRLICQMLQALDYAHAKGFVHRDIKPSNLLLSRENGEERALLADFGLARVYQASKFSGLTLTGDVGGTFPFMAPEQITNFRNVMPAADQYSAAATLYNLLTRRFVHDFPRLDEQMLLKILHSVPVPIESRHSDIPSGLARIIHRSLAREPGDRYANVNVMRKELLKFCR